MHSDKFISSTVRMESNQEGTSNNLGQIMKGRIIASYDWRVTYPESTKNKAVDATRFNESSFSSL
jgi:hypothetical protein